MKFSWWRWCLAVVVRTVDGNDSITRLPEEALDDASGIPGSCVPADSGKVTWGGKEGVVIDSLIDGTREVAERVLSAMNNYAIWHAEAVARLVAKEPLPSDRVVIFKCRAITGMGNHIEGFLSVYLYAVLTSRVILYYPFKGLEQLELTLPGALAEPVEVHLKAMGWEPSELSWGSPLPSQCDDDTLREELWIISGENCYSGSMLWHNPRTRDRMFELFGPAELGINQVAIVMQRLFQPKPDVREHLDAFVQSHFMDSKGKRAWVIGIHARTTESFARDPISLGLFASCALEQATAALAQGKEEIVFYLATDSESSRQKISQELGSLGRIVNAGDFIDDEYNLRVLDFLLLSACDDLVVTVGSSFSRLASARGDVAPAFVTFESKIWNLVHPANQCRRGLTARPCSMRYHGTLYDAPCFRGVPEKLKFLKEECDVH